MAVCCHIVVLIRADLAQGQFPNCLDDKTGYFSVINDAWFCFYNMIMMLQSVQLQ